MRTRFSPPLLVAVLALVLAAGGTGYAAGKITSRQIQDGTIQGRDVRNGTLTGLDVKDGTIQGREIRNGTLTGLDVKAGSIPRAKLDRACAAAEVRVFGGCVRSAASGPSSYQAALDDCNQRDGRLPTTAEILWIAAHTDDFGWADGNPSQYEFTGDYTSGATYTPIAFDRGGNVIGNASAQLFWHHCVTS